MAEIHVRNVYVTGATTTTVPERFGFFMLRELYLVGGWTEVDKDTDVNWTSASNILLSLSDFAVSTTEDLKVTSPTGGFDSSHEGLMITLFASDDSNRGLYNIRAVADSNTLFVDARTRPMAWNSNESGITGRIHKATLGAPFTTTSGFFVVQAPAASGRNLQLRFRHTGSDTVWVKAYPLGDYAGAGNDTTEIAMDMYNHVTQRYSAYFADDLATKWYTHIFYYEDYSGSSFYNLTAGELYNVAAGDNNPGFITFNVDFDDAFPTAMYMLNEVNAPTTFYNTCFNYYTGSDYDNSRHKLLACKRINGNRYKVLNPTVVGDNNADGSFIRGSNPRPFIHYNGPQWESFGADYWALAQGSLLPKNGTDDVIILRSLAA